MRLARSKVHFIGIGGIGMCGLAELLHNMGAKVTGSDLHQNAQTKRLSDLGIAISIGHNASVIEDKDVVVYSSAVKPDNIEYRAARSKMIPLIGRAEALAELMHLKRGVAVAGTHGKTTTTSFVSSAFLQAGSDPTIVVGGKLAKLRSTAQLGKGDWLIAEADESDGSFTRLSPEIVVVTNIDNDHLDHYGSFDNLKKAFINFASRLPFYGVLIACGDDPTVREIYADFPKKILYYGFETDNDFIVKLAEGRCRIENEGQLVAEFGSPLPGRHNALNATASFLVGQVAGLKTEDIVEGLETFSGVDRRFQHLGTVNGADIYDDYGHHPTEIRAVLSAFKETFPQRRLRVLFQPHRYSRTQQCWNEFLTCFGDADELYLLDIYPAGESPIAGFSSYELSQKIDHRHCKYMDSKDAALMKLKQELEKGDILLTLGAGDLWRLAPQLL